MGEVTEDPPQDQVDQDLTQDMQPGDPAEEPQPVEATPAPALTREEIIDALVKRGAKRDRATLYADAFLEYREASGNIAENGTIVLHPRTANPVENPYLKIRDRALKKLQSIKGIKADWLW